MLTGTIKLKLAMPKSFTDHPLSRKVKTSQARNSINSYMNGIQVRELSNKENLCIGGGCLEAAAGTVSKSGAVRGKRQHALPEQAKATCACVRVVSV